MSKKMIEQTPRPGDVIYVHRKRRGLIPPYDHYGIYIGDDGRLTEQVISFRGETKEISFSKADIIQTDLFEFLNGGELQIQDRNFFGDEYPPFPPKEIIKRAKQGLGRAKKTYGLWTHNCEHWANDIRYGRHESSQVKKVLKKTAKGTAKAAGIVGSIFLGKFIKKKFFDKNDPI